MMMIMSKMVRRGAATRRASDLAVRRGVRWLSGLSGRDAKVCAVLGSQWGDEGKGKLVDILAKDFDIVARFNGGANAGHTLVVDGRKFAFHLLPCGMLYEDKVNVIGNGVVLHVPTLLTEMAQLEEANIDSTLKISNRAHLLFDFHQIVDGAQEAGLGEANIGTTKRGIGPCYSSKASRNGVRVSDLVGDWDGFKAKYNKLLSDWQRTYDFEYDAEEELARFAEYRKILSPMAIDTVYYLNDALSTGKRVLTEGANAAMLDIDFGTYPYVTSSSTSIGGISTGLGIAPKHIETVVGVVKAYTTRVGAGPFPTEDVGAAGDHLAKVGHEFGTTTGRPRRCGWLDVPQLRYSAMLTGVTSINITKLDVLTGLDEVRLCTQYKLNGEALPLGLMPADLDHLGAVECVYETMPGWTEDITECTEFSQLPEAAKRYVQRLEELIGVPVSWVGVGPSRDAMLQLVQ
eukprot:TRINITY_DN21341_c0_g1_i1.p2 TRINITY_DN21341_c0_g1~~TRINITY_DN21341_c0_g1_i1.p2  ORF type:complete len:472 (+),score=225.99 TRINITY_DN21341_c0_g1_i1:37-1416(+)